MIHCKESRNIVQNCRDGASMTAEVQLKLVKNLEGMGRSVQTALWSKGPIEKNIEAFLPLFLSIGEGCTG